MDKITYLAELAEGLARWVPERERQDILRYYAEYFEEAGPEREAEVVAELGDPWALSCRLAVEGGYVTREKAASWKPRKTWPKVLIGTAVGLSVFALVAGIGLAFNVVRNVSGFVSTEFSQAYAVGWDGYGLAFAEDPEGAMGYYLMDSESMASFHSIDADISLGNVQVVAGDDFTLSVRFGDTLEGCEPAWEVRDGVLRLRDGRGAQAQMNDWDDLKSLFGMGWLVMDVTITVPDGAGMDKISVKTGLGSVLLYGLNVKTVTVETGLGNVECYEAWHVGWLELNTGMGNINLDLEEVCSGVNIGLESGMGNIEAILCGAEENFAYKLESGIGTVTVNGVSRGREAERRGNMPYRLDAESGTGDVSVYFTFD